MPALQNLQMTYEVLQAAMWRSLTFKDLADQGSNDLLRHGPQLPIPERVFQYISYCIWLFTRHHGPIVAAGCSVCLRDGDLPIAKPVSQSCQQWCNATASFLL